MNEENGRTSNGDAAEGEKRAERSHVHNFPVDSERRGGSSTTPEKSNGRERERTGVNPIAFSLLPSLNVRLRSEERRVGKVCPV